MRARVWRLGAPLALLAAVMAQPARAEPGVAVQVTVTNVRSGRGLVRVAICPRGSFLAPTCPWHAFAPARQGAVTVTVSDVPPGTYAAQAYQDETEINRIPRSLFGIPQVGIGFSNDAPFRFGPPTFADAAFRLTEAGGAISLRLRYFD